MNRSELSAWCREHSRQGAALVVIVLLALAAALASRIREIGVAAPASSDVRLGLPERIGDWTGDLIYYCQKERCLRAFTGRELEDVHACPVCQGPLDQVSLGERTLLPADTLISRRLYRDPQGNVMTVTVVLSGHEQRSIHRPQQCLPAQGFAIEQSERLAVPMEGRPPLVLALIRARRGSGGPYAAGMLMAYWFAGGGHETHSHFRRLAYMAWDNIVHGVRPRWAYVSLQTADSARPGVAESRISDFARRLHPLLKAPPAQ